MDRIFFSASRLEAYFFFVNYTGQKILKLRSVGLSLEEIKQSYRHLIGASEEDDIEHGWRIDTFSLLVLASRLMQESLSPMAVLAEGTGGGYGRISRGPEQRFRLN